MLYNNEHMIDTVSIATASPKKGTMSSVITSTSTICTEKNSLGSNELTKNWLQQFKVEKGQKSSHTLMSGGAFNIPDHQLPKLFQLLANDPTPLSLTEAHVPDYSPIIIDFDFRFSSKPSKRTVNDHLIEQIVQLYHTHLIAMGVSEDSLSPTFALTRKDGYQDDDLYKDGFHLHFPMLVIDYESQFELRRRVIQDLTHMNDFPKTTNSLDDVVDEAVIKRNNWLLLGCQKPGRPPYQIHKIYTNFDHIITGQSFKNSILKDYTNQELIELLSIRYIADRPVTKTNYIPKQISNQNEIFGGISADSKINVMPKKISRNAPKNESNQNENLGAIPADSKINIPLTSKKFVECAPKNESDQSKQSQKVIDLFKTHHPDANLLSVSGSDNENVFYEFSKSNCPCLLCHRVHKHNRQYVIYNQKSKRCIYKCHDTDAVGRKLYLFKPLYQIIRPDELVHVEDIPSLDFHNKKCLMIESNMGTSKTKQTVKYLLDVSPKTRILFITYRRILSKKYQSEAEHLGLVNYLDIKKRLIDQPRVVVQLDSLYRLNGGLHNWDIVVIDEIDSVLGQFGSPLMKLKNNNSEVLEYVIAQSQKTILLDANLNSQRVCDFVNSMFKREEIHYVKNTYIRSSNRLVHIKEQESGLIDQLTTSLKNGKNVVIISTSKKFLNRMEKIAATLVASDQIMFYSSDKNHKRLMTDGLNANQNWKHLRVLGYTPVISSGISFELDHFDQLFIHCGPKSCDYLSLFQMIFRVRQLRSGDMYMYINPQKNTYPTKFAQIEKLMEDSHSEVHYVMGENYLYKKIKPGYTYYYPIKDWIYQLYINNLIVRFRSENNFTKEIIRMLSTMHIPFVQDENITDEVKQAVNQTVRDVDKMIKDDYIDLVYHAPIITSDEYTQLKNNENATPIEKASILKYHCQEVYQVDYLAMTPEFIQQHVSYQQTGQYLNRCKLNHPNLGDELKLIVKNGLQKSREIDQPFDYFDAKHEHFQILLSCLLLQNILGLKNLTQSEIERFELTGQQLNDCWKKYHNELVNKIETWTFTMRDNHSKMIHKKRCLNWDNKGFTAFMNSVIAHNLGLHLKVTKKNKKDSMKAIYHLVDDFADMKLRSINIVDALPRGQCLIETGEKPKIKLQLKKKTKGGFGCPNPKLLDTEETTTIQHPLEKLKVKIQPKIKPTGGGFGCPSSKLLDTILDEDEIETP